jgi:hypothetical protein
LLIILLEAAGLQFAPAVVELVVHPVAVPAEFGLSQIRAVPQDFASFLHCFVEWMILLLYQPNLLKEEKA